jgi:hypothetical protein
MGDQNEGGQVVDVLVDQNRAGPFAAGTGLDGFGPHAPRLVCQNRHYERADGPSRDGPSGGGLNWGG